MTGITMNTSHHPDLSRAAFNGDSAAVGEAPLEDLREALGEAIHACRSTAMVASEAWADVAAGGGTDAIESAERAAGRHHKWKAAASLIRLALQVRGEQ